jgi:hypothetical protein
MKYHYAYFKHSRVEAGAVSFAPNLTREAVAFDAPLRQPLKFREAMSALHDVVVSDLRYQKRDKSAYEEWKKQEDARLANVRSEAVAAAREQIAAKVKAPLPDGLERHHGQMLKKYWRARNTYDAHLRKHDPELWRALVPYDPVITVADDVVFFECFSADESSYGCLSVDRAETFGASDSVKFGTTNVDYSWDLFDSFQSLRSYRETRFQIDPDGFNVATTGVADYREDKIDLPAGWLRGFMQVQAAMTLPLRKVTLTREAVYSLLAYLKRNKARTSPRALRFNLVHGQPISLTLEPWAQEIPVHGAAFEGKTQEPIRIWGRQRLLALARLLPIAEQVDVYLLGTGLPSFWVVKMGGMNFTLGMSGWTTNDWTRGSALDLLAPPQHPTADLSMKLSAVLRQHGAAPLAQLVTQGGESIGVTAASLKDLAHTGQVMFDLPHQVYRWRQIMPLALGQQEMGPENAELVASRTLVAKGKARLLSETPAPSGGTIYTGNVETKPVEMLINSDGRIARGKCLCGHFQKAGLRMGPCRHLLALRTLVSRRENLDQSVAHWYEQLVAATK